MVNKLTNAQNNCQGFDEDSLDILRDENDFSGEGNYVISGSKLERLIPWVNPPQQALVLFNTTRYSLDHRIPKPIISLDEKYLRRCLELIHFQASRMSRSNVADSIGILTETGDGFDSPRLLFDCPMVVGGEAGSVAVGPTGQWILGSDSIIARTKSPLLHRYAASDTNVDGPIRFNLVESSPIASLSLSSSPMRFDKGTTTLKITEKYKHDSKIRFSMSSTNSVSSSDQTSTSASASTSVIGQGMVKCTWRSGTPRFVFSADDHKDMVYVADMRKVESRDERALDYIYSFHSGGSNLVGKMKVSNSLTLGESDSNVAETEFVLFGENEVTPSPTTSHNCLSKHRGFSKKVADVFRFSGPIQENCTLDAGSMGPTLSPANLELAAIVVRDRAVVVDDTREEEEEVSGGWGLKFLKKVKVKQNQTTTKFDQSNGNCSTSMDVLIPAGPHGGPTMINGGGPSSLVERWKSGGKCDCGGWDIGCPVSVLKPKSNRDEDEEAQVQEEFKSFDLITQGSDHFGAPTLRLVNVEEGLYFVHFQRTLSILQSFSIAVAIIHARSPTLRPKDVHGLK